MMANIPPTYLLEELVPVFNQIVECEGKFINGDFEKAYRDSYTLALHGQSAQLRLAIHNAIKASCEKSFIRQLRQLVYSADVAPKAAAASASGPGNGKSSKRARYAFRHQ
jgi:hypothetical protein